MAVILTSTENTLDEFRVNTNNISTILGDNEDLSTEFTGVNPKNIVNILKDIDSRFKDVSGETASIKAVKKIMSGGYGWAVASDNLEQPINIIYSLGLEKVKISLTWSTSGASEGNVTGAFYSYSSNNGVSYTPVITETISYNLTTGIATGISWS